MSSIDKLSVRGIRSFGIKSEDQQVIVFGSPLTLILGANGSGKTTIIECLKYALTGDLPPGSDKGKSFVHDPKIFDFAECLGQVKLAVKNLREEKLTVTRSMKTGYRRGKLYFETLDGTIHTEDADGNKATISTRCVDVNKETCQFMGVSKAIINNVLFCHQEDSDWPLDEAKKLKEKFDAIFGTTEYNKAIDKIIKLRKVQMDQLKFKDADLKVLEHLKKETENKNLDLENAEKKLENLKITRKKFDEDMEPVQKRIDKIYEIELEAGKLQSKRTELGTKLENCKEQSQNLKSKIKKLFNGDLTMLDGEIRSFKNQIYEKQDQLRDLENQLVVLKKQEQKISETITVLDRQRTTLINQRQKEQDYLSERADKVKDLCTQLKIVVDGDLEESSTYIDSIMREIYAAFGRRDREITETSTKHDAEDQDLQRKIDKLREAKASAESSIRSKISQRNQLESEQRKIRTEITSAEKSAEGLKKLTEQIEEIEKVYAEYSQSINLDSLKSSIEQTRNNIKELQEKHDKLDEKLTFLNSITKLTAEIDIKEKEFEKRESEMKRVKSKHSDNFKKIFGNRTIESNFKRNIQSSCENLQRQINDISKQINASKLKEKELQTIRKNQKDELVKFQKELEDSKERIFDKCHSNPYEEILARAKENIEKLQLDHGALKSAEAMYKKYIKKIEEDPCCPLCHKGITSDEATDLTSELSDEIHRLPDSIERAERQLKSEQRKYEDLLGLKPVIERVEFLESNIPKYKQNLKRTEEQLAEAANDVESLQLTEAEPSGLLEIARSMFGDMTLLDEAIKDVSRIGTELETFKKKLPERSENISLEEAQQEKTSVATTLKTERSQLEELQSRHMKENDMLNKLREKRNNLKDKQIQLQERVQALSQLKTRLEEISAQTEQINKDIKDFEDKLGPTKSELESLTKRKDKLKEDNKKALQEMQRKLNSLKQIDLDVKRYTKELKELEKLNLAVEIDRVKSKLISHTEERKSKEKENDQMRVSIENLKTEISNQEIQERNLNDNRELKLLEQKGEELQVQYDELIKDMGELNFRSLKKEKEELTKKRDHITVKVGEILGQTGEINNQINALRKELSQPKYRDSIKNYRQNFYETQVLKKIIADLGNYRVALEFALMKFHEEKMDKINRLIRELWRQIYRGNDIDYIQIQTVADDIKTDGADKKRNYNYRVIQSKNNSEIDMRGRCSAGQRVLSSLIIRMALAETFSSNCGVLALDEPTTNLDRINILSLCEALNKIVQERQAQSNFMLIIITHDEEFIQTLGHIERYHKVFRNNDGKSVIQKMRVQ